MKNGYCNELHEAYKKSIDAFSKSYPNANSALLTQIENYSRACALYLWALFDVNTDDCVKAINEIYVQDRNNIYAKEHIEAAKEKLNTRNYSMPVPQFFYDIIAFDKNNNTNYSRLLANCFQILDIVYAIIDDNVEKGEAETITLLQDELIKACNVDGILPAKNEIDPNDYIDLNRKRQLVVTADNNDSKDLCFKSGSKYTDNTIQTTISFGKNENDNTSSMEDKKSFDAMVELDNLIGLTKAKKEIHEVSDFAKIQKARKDQGLPVSEISFHLVFTGNPGTGKTTVARLVAKIYKNLGVVSEGQLIEVSAKDLVAGYVGQTAIKTGEIIEKAKGGVLFIDEAYTLLDKSGQGFGQEAIDTLLKEMEDCRDNLAVIVAGYDNLMKDFIDSNPGLKSRFNKYIHFDDYSSEEMYQIYELLCKKGAYNTSKEASDELKNYFDYICQHPDKSFANGRTVRNVFEKIISKQAKRIASEKEITKELLSSIEAVDVIDSVGMISPKEEKLEDILDSLYSLAGLNQVKKEISELTYIVQNQQRRKNQGLKVPLLSLHLVFTGNPGTGKTTVARLVAKIYKCLGLLSNGQLIETDRSGLVAGYVGQTAIKTQDMIQKAIGGVLFIDEAYTLSNGGTNDFGQEAIDTLLKAMEDHREDLVVIVAGYEDLMEEFIKSNPGLGSRFNRYIHFEDYSANQLFEIFNVLCENNQYLLDDDAQNVLMQYFERINSSSIGNGRGVRNLFEKIVTQQAKRIERNSSVEGFDLQSIVKDDVFNSISNVEINNRTLTNNTVSETKNNSVDTDYSIEKLFPPQSEIGDLYSTLREIVLGFDANQEEYATKLYSTFKLGKRKTISVWPKSKWIEVILNAKIGQINDPYGLLYDITNRKWSAAQYAFKFSSETNLEIVRDYINQMIDIAKQ